MRIILEPIWDFLKLVQIVACAGLIWSASGCKEVRNDSSRRASDGMTPPGGPVVNPAQTGAHNARKQVIEFEKLRHVNVSAGLQMGPQVIGSSLPPFKWSGGAQLLARAASSGASATFMLPADFVRSRIYLYPAQSFDFGILDLYVNDTLVVKTWDGYATAARPGTPIDLGEHAAEFGNFRIKAVVTGKNPDSSGYSFAFDCISLEDLEESESGAEIREFLDSSAFDARPASGWPRLIGLVKRPWGTSAVAILWNPGSSDQAVTLDFAAAGLDPEREHAIWSFRDGRFLGFARGSWLTPLLPATGSMIVHIVEIDRSRKTPALVGSNLHKYCGALEVRRFDPARSDLEIELADVGARQGALFVHSPFGLLPKSSQGCVVESVERMEENIWKINLTNLEPGRVHQIRLGLMLPLMQRPLTWMILGIISATVFFGIWWLVHRQRSQLALARLEQQNALERERLRIARDIHDEVGANLTKIGELIHSMNENTSNHIASPVLRDMADTTRAVVQAMDEIVWAINPGNDSLENMANYLVHYAVEFVRPSGIECELDVPILLPAIPVATETRHNLFLTIKEALNNAVKHSGSRHVRVHLSHSDGTLVIQVGDDGGGFSPLKAGSGADGLNNMRARMTAIGGEFDLQTAPGKGTTITLRVPLAV